MADRRNGTKWIFDNPKKKTKQGNGRFTKSPSKGGERFLAGLREGSPPTRARRKKKPYRGQGK
jgi:hypothetical protein|tara:strand:+ start:215 stop:403 length:189 start_codon:yes stop_codon:yes gene_type:complete